MLRHIIFREGVVEGFKEHDVGFAFIEIGLILAGIAFALSFFHQQMALVVLWADIAYFSLVIIVASFSKDPLNDFDPVLALIGFTSVGSLLYYVVSIFDAVGAKRILLFVMLCDLVILVIGWILHNFVRKNLY